MKVATLAVIPVKQCFMYLGIAKKLVQCGTCGGPQVIYQESFWEGSLSQWLNLNVADWKNVLKVIYQDEKY